jgi:hypothetical protein
MFALGIDANYHTFHYVRTRPRPDRDVAPDIPVPSLLETLSVSVITQSLFPATVNDTDCQTYLALWGYLDSSVTDDGHERARVEKNL